MLLPFAALGEPACLPQVLTRLLPLIEARAASADVEVLIGADPVLCLQLLALAAPERQSRVTLATLLASCGSEALHSLVLTAAVRQLPASAPPEATQRVWRRCLLMACSARRLAKFLGYSSPEEAYLAALLLRSGQLVMTLQGGDGYAQMLAANQHDERQQLVQERREYGATHLQLSTTLLQSSGLSPMALDALRYHSVEPELLREAHPLTRILRLADLIACKASNARAAESAALWFGLDQADVAALANHSRNDLQALLLRLGLLPQSANSAADERPYPSLADVVARAALFPAAVVDGDSIWRKLKTSLTLHCGLNAALLLRYNASVKTLQGSADDVALATTDFSLRCAARQSLAADAYQLGQARNSFEHGWSVADEQIARLLGKTGLLCLPFAAGVLVLGIESVELSHLQLRLSAVQALLDSAGRALPQPLAAAPDEDFQRRIRVAQHEIAAPLTTLRNYLHVLQSKSSGADEELRIMRGELSRIARLVERIAKTAADLQADTVDINGLLGDVLAGFQLAARGIDIQADLAPALPHLLSDAVALKQIFTNLIQNALEAMAHGGRLRLSSEISHEGQQIVITVADTGSGIAAALLPQLFVAKTSSKPGHSGLGLSIVKQLLDALGGTVDCQSLPQVGTRFLVSLPQRLPQ